MAGVTGPTSYKTKWDVAGIYHAMCDFPCNIVPVSYTHLDVYKRQGQVRTRIVLCPRERATVFKEAENVVAGRIVTIDPADLAVAVAEHSSQRFRPIPIQPSDALEIVFTSGTTAEPKGVVLTHANVVGNLIPIEAEIRKYLKYESCLLYTSRCV